MLVTPAYSVLRPCIASVHCGLLLLLVGTKVVQAGYRRDHVTHLTAFPTPA